MKDKMMMMMMKIKKSIFPLNDDKNDDENFLILSEHLKPRMAFSLRVNKQIQSNEKNHCTEAQWNFQNQWNMNVHMVTKKARKCVQIDTLAFIMEMIKEQEK